jgi:hypothetical protein
MDNVFEAIFMGFGAVLFCLAISLLMLSDMEINKLMENQKSIVYINNVIDLF